MFGIGMGELILILIVAFIVVGPAELPRVARWIGRAVKTARRAAGELGDAVQAGELKKIAGESGEELKDLKKLQDELKENIKL
jgi:sec-independent protein translocase protein TatB